jgi:FtsP/CotA-like multicopper oxidase with cupredoxin domain/subtilisin-like proprotein convertase family protein
MNKNNLRYLISALLILAILSSSLAMNTTKAQIIDAPTLDPLTIPKYADQLVIPPVYVPTNVADFCGNLIRQEYTVSMSEFYQQILPPGFPKTLVWGYGGYAKDAVTGAYLGFVRNSPGPTFEAIRDVPIQVRWVNKVTRQIFAVDPTLHWANPNNMPEMPTDPYPTFPPGFPEAQMPVPLVTHLHGGEVQSTSDGNPDAWFTANGLRGPGYNSLYPTSSDAAVFYYPNEQLPTTLWYHDHALGITRTNVMSGLAGFYLLRDYAASSDSVAPLLPAGKYEIPIAIQDRSFNLDGSMWFPKEGINPDIHPYWQPEFFGNTIMVNGKLWPNLNVDMGQYRFRLLDGSNARFYNLTLTDTSTGNMVPFTQIGSDGGYLKTAVPLNWLLIAPGERADILVDFSSFAPGTKIIMNNTAAAPFPDGDPADPETVGQIMQFTVMDTSGTAPASLPSTLNPTLQASFPTLPSPDLTRTLPFFEEMGTNGPLGLFLNGQKWDGVLTEVPQAGATEDWLFVNPTIDSHPLHLHLVQFQILYRVPFDAAAYEADWIDLNGVPPVPIGVVPETLAVDSYLTGPPEDPAPNEIGWKDTIQTMPGYVTAIRVRFAPQAAPTTGPYAPSAGINLFPFDPSAGPGYVWHCHIIDHEDNEMMRPYKVAPGSPLALAKIFIEHTWVGDLNITLGCGNPSSPLWSQLIWNRAGGSQRNLSLTVDLSSAVAYLPPSDMYRWYLKVYDAAAADTGRIVTFNITYQGKTYSSTDVPVPIKDFNTSYAYIPRNCASAHIYIEHTYRGDLVVDIGVGNTASPLWSSRVWNRQGGSADNLNLTVDLSVAAAYLPPSNTYTWFLKVYDAASGDQGRITQLSITYQGVTYTSTDVPVPVADLKTSYAYIPSPAQAHVYIQHTYRGDLIVDIGVGSTSAPLWSKRVWSGTGGSADNLDLYVDISGALAYLPPSATYTWWVKVYDRAARDTGKIVTFTIAFQGKTYTSPNVPVPIYDLQTSYAYIPS